MAERGEDPYMRGFNREIQYLRSILNSLKPVTYREGADWTRVVEKQQEVLNTLRGDFAIKMTDLEQRLKQNSVRIFGIRERRTPEDTVEVVRDYFSEQLRLTIFREDIENCYRCGKVTTTKDEDVRHRRTGRPVVVKFVSEDVRKRVWRRKIALRRYDICEELCPERYQIKKEAIARYGKHNVSIVDGNVQVTIPGRDYHCERFSTIVQFRNFLEASDRAETFPEQFFSNWEG